MGKLRSLFTFSGGGTESDEQEKFDERGPILKSSLREGDGRNSKKNDKGRKRDEASVRTHEQENEELRRFEKLVWNQVTDVHLRSSSADSNERLQMNYIARISYRILSGRMNQLLQETQQNGEQLERRCKELGERIDTLTQVHGEDLARKNAQHVLDLRQAEVKYQQELYKTEQIHKGETKTLIEKCNWHLNAKNGEIESLKLQHADEIATFDNILSEMKSKLQATEQDKNFQIEKLKYDHEIHVQSLIKESADQAADYESSINIMKKDHADELAQLKETHHKEVVTLVAQHDKTSRSLKDEVHGLKNVLLKRDDDAFLPLTLSDADTKQESDEHIKVKFSEIEQRVDDLSRLVWKSEQKVWTDQLLRKIDAKDDQRLLKKHILQDSIWSMLHLYVFCSPFRVLGKEGENLENEWSRNFLEDPEFDNGVYTWPSLGIEAERWRYVTVRECRRALMKAIPSQYDPRAKVKKGFMTASGNLVAELKSMLDEMVEYSAADAKCVEQLVLKVANVWLEFGMHRCRFILIMGSSHSQPAVEKARQAEKGNLELTIVPGLRRHGDVKGVELASSTIVGGLKGEFSKLS